MKVIEKFKKLYLHDSTLKGISFDFSGEKVNLILYIDLERENRDFNLEEFRKGKGFPKFIKNPSILKFINCIRFTYKNEDLVVTNIVDSDISEDTSLLKESIENLKDNKFYHFTIGLYPMELSIIAKDFELIEGINEIV